MPFASRRQQRAAFAGRIPGIDPHEWAKDTDFKKLPERAPAEKGKPTMRSKKAAVQFFIDEATSAEDFLAQVFKVAALGSAVLKPNNVGKLRGMMTSNALKAPGYSAATQAMNPRKNVISAMTKSKPH
jgi:hypothetical protein